LVFEPEFEIVENNAISTEEVELAYDPEGDFSLATLYDELKELPQYEGAEDI